MIKIIYEKDLLLTKNICLLIYGQPGVGKTSTSFTADKPLLFDFDGGARRAYRRLDSIQITKWEDIVNMSVNDFADYQTIVIDTVGRLLDILTVNIIQQNPKMRGFGGALSLQGYGALKASYAGWLNQILSYGKDVVLLAHDKEDKKGEELMVRPDIQGSSLGEVVKKADGVGYMHIVGGARTLDFSPSDEWIGKNVGNFSTLAIPDFADSFDFLAGVISEIKNKLNKMDEEQKQAVAEITRWKEIIDGAIDAKTINELIKSIAGIKNPLLPQLKKMIVDKAKKLNLNFDKTLGEYK